MIIILPTLYLITSEYVNLTRIKNDPVSLAVHPINNNNLII